MAVSSTNEVTRLLVAWSAGDQEALDQLAPLVEAELERLAHSYLRKERAAHTLQTGALVNEAYLRLINWQAVEWQDRAHFFGVASKAMRHILVDYARAIQSRKRGGWQERITLSEQISSSNEKRSNEIVALDEALNRLSALDERKSRVVELKYFGGLTNEEIAEVLKISPETAKRDWRFSRTWLLRELAVEK